MHWRAWTGLFVLIFGVLLAVWIKWGVPSAEKAIHARVESLLHQSLKQPVQIDSVEIHPFLFYVAFHHVRVGPENQPLFSCDSWFFRLTFFHAIRFRSSVFFSLGKSKIYSPRIHIKEEWFSTVSARKGLSSSPLKGAMAFFLASLEWEDGEFGLPAFSKIPAMQIRQSKGDLDIGSKGVSLSGRGESPFGAFRLSAECQIDSVLGLKEDFPWSAALFLEKFTIEEFMSYVPLTQGAWSGDVDLRVRAEGRKNQVKDWAVEGVVSEGMWSLNVSESQSSSVCVPFEGPFKISPKAVSFDEFLVFDRISMSGVYKGPFKESGEWDMNLRGKNFPLTDFPRDIPRLGFLKYVPVRGVADFVMTLKGKSNNPEVDMQSSVKHARLAGVNVPHIDSNLTIQNGNLQAEAFLLSGKLSLSGQIMRGGDENEPVGSAWRAVIENWNLGELAEVNRWGEIGGRMRGDLLLKGMVAGRQKSEGIEQAGIVSPSAHGTLSIDDFVWGIHRSTGPVACYFSYDDGWLEIRGKKNQFRLSARNDYENIELSELFFKRSDGLLLKARGSVSGPQRQLDLQVLLQRAPFQDVPFLLERYSGISGVFDFDGTLTGKVSDPVFDGQLILNNLQIDEGVRTCSGRARFRWDGAGIHFPHIEIEGIGTGKGKWTPSEDWFLKLFIREADARFLTGFLRLRDELQGRFSGQLSVSSDKGWSPSDMALWGNLSFSEGTWKNTFFDKASVVFHMEDAVFHLEKIDVYQPSGVWHGQGKGKLDIKDSKLKNITWNVLTQFKHFTVDQIVYDGEVRAEGVMEWNTSGQKGVRRVRGEFLSPVFWVNNHGLGTIQGKFVSNNKQLALSQLRVGDNIQGYLNLDFSEEKIKGGFDFKKILLSDWHMLLGLNSPFFQTGYMNGSLRVHGHLLSPDVRFATQWHEVLWRNILFEGSVKGRYRDGEINIETLEAVVAEEGNVRGQGVMGKAVPGKAGVDRPIDLRLEMDNIPLQRLARSFDIRSHPLGFFDGVLRCQGTWKAPVVFADLAGKGLCFGHQDPMTWTGQAHYSNRQISIDHFVAQTSEGSWRVKKGSQVFLTGPQTAHFQLVNDLRNIHLGPLTFFGGLEITGQWNAQSELFCTSHLRAQSLWINQHYFDQDLASVVWSKEHVEFTQADAGFQGISGQIFFDQWPQLHFKDLCFWEDNKKRLLVQGEMGPHKWDFSLRGWDLHANALMGLADFDWSMDGFLHMSLTGHGSPLDPRLEGIVYGRDGSLWSIPYDQFSAEISLNGPVVKLTNIEAFRKNGYLVRGEGRFPVNRSEESNKDVSFLFHLKKGDFRVLKDIWPGCKKAKGRFDGQMQIQPGTNGPSATGYLNIRGGRVWAHKYFRFLRDLNARLFLKDNQIFFEEASCRLGRGKMIIAGHVGVKNFRVSNYDLSVDSVGKHGVQINVPQLSVPPGGFLKKFSILRESLQGASEGEPFVSLKLMGPHGQHRVEGTIVLENTHFTYPPSKKFRPKNRWIREFWKDTRWNILFKTAQNTWYRNNFVNVRVNGALQIDGKRGNMVVDGRVDSQQGIITYLGQTFKVKQGAFEVVTDKRSGVVDKAIVPYISGEAERVATTLDARGFSTPDLITMVIPRAPVGEIQPQFISRNNPGISSERVAQKSLGLSGEEQMTPAERDQLLRAGLVQLLGSTAGPLANRLAHRFGISMLYPIYEPDDMADTGTPLRPATVSEQRTDLKGFLQGAGATAGIQLSNRVFGLYKFKVDETQNQFYFRDEIEIIYRVAGRLHLRASTELDSKKLLGQPPNRQAVLEHQWRFGLPRKHKRKEKSSLETLARLNRMTLN